MQWVSCSKVIISIVYLLVYTIFTALHRMTCNGCIPHTLIIAFKCNHKGLSPGCVTINESDKSA